MLTEKIGFTLNLKSTHSMYVHHLGVTECLVSDGDETVDICSRRIMYEHELVGEVSPRVALIFSQIIRICAGSRSSCPGSRSSCALSIATCAADATSQRTFLNTSKSSFGSRSLRILFR